MAYLLVDPEGVLSFSHDWSDWLDYSSPADTIASRLWTIEPLHGTSPETPTLTNATADIVLVQGLLAGNVYRLTERVTSGSGLVDDRTIVLRCDST